MSGLAGVAREAVSAVMAARADARHAILVAFDAGELTIEEVAGLYDNLLISWPSREDPLGGGVSVEQARRLLDLHREAVTES